MKSVPLMDPCIIYSPELEHLESFAELYNLTVDHSEHFNHHKSSITGLVDLVRSLFHRIVRLPFSFFPDP